MTPRRRFGLSAFITALAALTAPAHARDKPAETSRQQIERVLQQSAQDWSRGDLAAFMRSYEDAPTTAFVTAGGLLQGYADIKSHYAAHYGTGQKMGALRLEVLNERELDPAYALVTGRFTLDRPKADGGPATGIFTLLFHHGASGWRIAYDHTS